MDETGKLVKALRCCSDTSTMECSDFESGGRRRERMLSYDDLAPRFVTECAFCKETMLKKKTVTLYCRNRTSAPVKTLCHVCPRCWTEFLEKNGLSEP